jgi:hypothetical protein
MGAKHLSYGGRLVLINIVLSSLPIFMMFVFKISKGVLRNSDLYGSRSFGKVTMINKNITGQNGTSCVEPKDQGRVGITDLWIKNKCLFIKWLFKLLHEEGTWQSLLINKFLSSKYLKN